MEITLKGTMEKQMSAMHKIKYKNHDISRHEGRATIETRETLTLETHESLSLVSTRSV